MVMSQGTYTFLACFSGFWLVWALVVMLCCLCSFLQRRLKRRREERRREQCLRSVDMEPLDAAYPPAPPPALPPPAATAAVPLPLPVPPPPQHQQLPPREPLPAPPAFCPPQTMAPPIALHVPIPLPQATWVSIPDADVCGKPPCYEEAVLMEDPPPPYSEVLADPRGGTYLKPAPLRATVAPLRATVAPLLPPPSCSLTLRPDCHLPLPVFTCETSKPLAAAAAAAMFPDRGYSSLIRLPSSQRWDSLGHLLSNMDLDHQELAPPGPRAGTSAAAVAVATMPRREARTRHRRDGLGLGLRGGFQGLQGRMQGVPGLGALEPPCGVPTAFPLLGRSTAV